MTWDPLRRKEVADTPEERVRQWFIGVLEQAGVPAGLMGSEVALDNAAKAYRADIVVYDRSGQPLAIVECKRPGVSITKSVAEQALRYYGVLGARYIMLTNGKNTFIYRKEGDAFVSCDALPSYEMMSCQP